MTSFSQYYVDPHLPVHPRAPPVQHQDRILDVLFSSPGVLGHSAGARLLGAAQRRPPGFYCVVLSPRAHGFGQVRDGGLRHSRL